MKLHRIIPGLVHSLAILGTVTIWADPFQSSQVSSEAVWYVHLDLERLKQTEVGRHLMTELEKPGNKDRLAIFQAMFNFDPRKAIKGGTLYSQGADPDDAVLLLHGDFDTDHLQTLATSGKDYTSSQHRSCTIHGWGDPARAGRVGLKSRSYGALHSSGAVVLGQKSSRVAEALDVLDQVNANLEKAGPLKQAGANQSTAFLVAAARQADLSRIAPQTAVLKHFKTLAISANEADDKIVLESVVEADNAEAAQNIQSLAQGLVALAALQNNRPEAAKLAQGITVNRKETGVQASLSLPVADVIAMFKQVASRQSGAR